MIEVSSSFYYHIAYNRKQSFNTEKGSVIMHHLKFGFWALVILIASSAVRVPAADENKTGAQIDESSYVYALMRTNMGDILVELDTVKAPATCANFLQYCQSGFYDSTIFHRVISDFMIQGGGFTIDMMRKPTREPIVNEWQNGLKNKRGTIAMARLGKKPNSATSQFFINVKDNLFLDQPQDGAAYAVFGRVVKGMEVVDRIRRVKTGTVQRFGDVPLEPIVIETVIRMETKDLNRIRGDSGAKEKGSLYPLHQAVAAADAAKVRELVTGGVDVNTRDTLSRSPLHLAAASGQADIAEILIKNGADLNAVNDSHETPLHLAASAGHGILVDLLLKNGAQVDSRDMPRGWTPLFRAVDNKFPAIAGKLLEFGADLNLQDDQKRTPLHVAVVRVDSSSVRLLIENGADLRAVDGEGRTPLALARSLGNDDIIDIITAVGGQE